MSSNEGNIISFKVFIDAKGILMTEYKKLPVEEVRKFSIKKTLPT